MPIGCDSHPIGALIPFSSHMKKIYAIVPVAVAMAASAQAAFADQATDLFNQVGSGALNSSSSVLNGPGGYMIYIAIALPFLVWIASEVRKFRSGGKR